MFHGFKIRPHLLNRAPVTCRFLAILSYDVVFVAIILFRHNGMELNEVGLFKFNIIILLQYLVGINVTKIVI